MKTTMHQGHGFSAGAAGTQDGYAESRKYLGSDATCMLQLLESQDLVNIDTWANIHLRQASRYSPSM